jgi:hypothetical protein
MLKSVKINALSSTVSTLWEKRIDFICSRKQSHYGQEKTEWNFSEDHRALLGWPKAQRNADFPINSTKHVEPSKTITARELHK